MTQMERIYAALKRGERLTHLTALRRFRCARLAARIGDLRDKGVPVQTTMVRSGDTRIARYSL